MHYHIPGIAGAGMSAIAHLLIDQGHSVSGCDPQRNALVDELIARGMVFFEGHAASHLHGVDVVATSSALRSDHPELTAAQSAGVPVYKRADLWRAWSQQKSTLAIAGTHGKTTTTALCALILEQLGFDPAYIVPAGGPVPGLSRFAKWGSGPFVIEADEYDRLFLGLLPRVALITSVDWDHVDVYPTRQAVADAFAQFARQTTGTVIVCQDDVGARQLPIGVDAGKAAPGPERQSYGLEVHADWWAGDIHMVAGRTRFVVRRGGKDDWQPVEVELQVPGLHNVQNALGAAVAVWTLLEEAIPFEQIAHALGNYQGASRRFEWKGEAGGVVIVDDYAHNPAKVRAALAAARLRYPERRLVAYFQPHTFSRTEALIGDFAAAFDAADLVLIGDIYPSRERQVDFPAITAQWLADRVQARDVRTAGDLDGAAALLQSLVAPGDLLLTMGAGDGYRVGEGVLRELRSAEQVVS